MLMLVVGGVLTFDYSVWMSFHYFVRFLPGRSCALSTGVDRRDLRIL